MMNFKLNTLLDYKKTFDPAHMLITATYSLLCNYSNKKLKIKRGDPILKKVTGLAAWNGYLTGYDKLLSDKILIIINKNNFELRTSVVGGDSKQKMAIAEIFFINEGETNNEPSVLIYRWSYFLDENYEITKELH
jgi:hypothetical protein